MEIGLERALIKSLSANRKQDVAIFLIVVVLLVVIVSLFVANLWFQYDNYREGIRIALEDPAGPDHGSVVAYARSWDFAVVKTSGLFMSLLLAFTGVLYVLRAGEAAFQLEAEHSEFKGTLSTSSPGLVMVAAAVVLASVVISHATYVGVVPQSVSVEEERGALENAAALEPVSTPPVTELEDLGFGEQVIGRE